jgi:hypothetical protein
MVLPVIEGARRHRGVLVVAVVASAGWVGVVVAYRLVLPVFGVLSPVTCSAIWAGWLWVIGVPVVAAIRLAARQVWWPAASVSTLAVLAAAGLWTVGPPELTPEGQFRQHRGDMQRLAAGFRIGLFDGDGALPWRMRSLSIDGHAHRRCGFTEMVVGRRDCALYLPAWQDWRAESGTGFAYYPTGPGPDASIVTAAGDIGKPSRELGDGWWWVE